MKGSLAFRKFESDLQDLLDGCESILDVGCGADSPLRGLRPHAQMVGVDNHDESLRRSAEHQIHQRYVKANIEQLNDHFEAHSFDAVVALDVIEHLPKEKGDAFLASLERIARRRVIVFTPNGFLAQGEYDTNPWQVHLSGWKASEMKARGYDVIGLRGWKPLRGEYATIRYRPKFLWLFLSSLSQLWVRTHPESAFQLLCVKNLS